MRDGLFCNRTSATFPPGRKPPANLPPAPPAPGDGNEAAGRLRLAKSQHKKHSADTSLRPETRNGRRKAACRLPGTDTVQAPSVHRACIVRPPCLHRPATVLARNAQTTRPKHAESPCGKPPKPAPPLAEGPAAPPTGLPEAAKRAFPLPGNRFFLSFKCQDFATRLPRSRLRKSASVFPCKPDRRPE